MTTRRWIAIVLALLTVPLLVLSLIDPLEGGLALLLVTAIGLVVWLLARVTPPKIGWIALLATIAVGALALGIAFSMLPPGVAPAGTPEDTARNPFQWLFALNWIYRLGVIVTAVGWVMWIVRLIRATRAPAPPQ